MNPDLLKKAIQKAKQSNSKYKISAIGFTKKFDYIGMTKNNVANLPRGGGHHAEHRLILKYGKSIKYIALVRVGHSGELLPIDPCKSCQRLIDLLEIKVITINAKV